MGKSSERPGEQRDVEDGVAEWQLEGTRVHELKVFLEITRPSRRRREQLVCPGVDAYDERCRVRVAKATNDGARILHL